MRVIGDLSRLSARRYPSKVALIMEDQCLTYAEIDNLSNRLAHALISRGVQAGDRVAVLAQNCLDYAVVTQAIAKCGAILVTINFRLVPSEIEFVMEDSGAKVLFFEEGYSTSVASIVPHLSVKPELVLIAPEKPSSSTTLPTYRDWMMSHPGDPPDREVDAQSAASIMYTSGTTGFPKGVVYSHAGYFRLFISNLVELDIDREDVLHVAMPMFHNVGLNGALNSMMLIGASGVVHRGSFDPETVLREIERHHISVVHWAPTMLAMLCNFEGFSRFDVSSLTKINYGGMPIELNVLRRAQAMFSAKAKFYQVYGATECGTVTVLRPEDHVCWSQTAGREAFNAESRVVNENMRDVAAGETGEIIVRARDNGMLGYWNNPQATAETVRDGWIHTGDLARVEKDSFLTIVGRKKEMIISGAENIYPREVETVLARHPAVEEVAVFRIRTPCSGKRFVPRSWSEVERRCRNRISNSFAWRI